MQILMQNVLTFMYNCFLGYELHPHPPTTTPNKKKFLQQLQAGS
jgi:hypothetical protein